MGETGQRGYALVTVLMLLALLMTLIASYFTLTRIELSTTRSSMDSFRGFYAAEAGLNLRAVGVRQTFEGYNRPAGTSPDEMNPCAGGNLGSDDFACQSYPFQGRSVATYLEEAPGNPRNIVIPRGEQFQNLNAQEYLYQAFARATSSAGDTEAMLEMHFKSRLVPMFQFAAFYNKDLEILPGPAMTLAGPVHTNGDLYLGSDDGGAGLRIEGQVTTAADLYRGRKNDDVCMTGTVSVIDPDVPTALAPCSGGRSVYTQDYLDGWNGMIQTGVEVLTVPDPEALDPDAGQIYYAEADVRIMLDLNGANPDVQVRNSGGGVQMIDSAVLDGCNAAEYSDGFYNNREGTAIEMLDVDLRGLLDCLHLNPLLDEGRQLDDTSEGGLVFYLGVDGPDMLGINNYGIRVRNGAELASTIGGAPEIRGLTVVSNQAVYVQGDYNSVEKKPAAFLGDSINILSGNWSDANDELALDQRIAVDTTINAAFLSGTDTTGGVEGAGGQDLAQYNGGLENYPRFHETWSGRTLTYRGSFVSLNNPRHVEGPWVYGGMQYRAPVRDWGYDTDFDDAANLPPLSPRFVYLRQELFVRRFEI